MVRFSGVAALQCNGVAALQSNGVAALQSNGVAALQSNECKSDVSLSKRSFWQSLSERICCVVVIENGDIEGFDSEEARGSCCGD